VHHPASGAEKATQRGPERNLGTIPGVNRRSTTEHYYIILVISIRV